MDKIDENSKNEYLEYIRNFRIIDDDFAKKVFDDKACTQEVLRIILDIPTLVVKTVKSEFEMHNLYGRSVRYDVFAIDADGTQYDIELQRNDKGANPMRARYNSSVMDANSLKRGKEPEELPESYVIFITENDVIGDDKMIYHIDRVVAETGKFFGDKEHIVYVNASAGNDGSQLGELIQDFMCADPYSIHNKVLSDKVKELKMTEKGVSNMSKVMEDFKADITAKVTKAVTEEVTKEVTKEVTEEVTKEVTAKERAKAAMEMAAKNRQLVTKMVLRGTSDTDIIDIFEISAEELAELKTELGIA